MWRVWRFSLILPYNDLVYPFAGPKDGWLRSSERWESCGEIFLEWRLNVLLLIFTMMWTWIGFIFLRSLNSLINPPKLIHDTNVRSSASPRWRAIFETCPLSFHLSYPFDLFILLNFFYGGTMESCSSDLFFVFPIFITLWLWFAIVKLCIHCDGLVGCSIRRRFSFLPRFSCISLRLWWAVGRQWTDA